MFSPQRQYDHASSSLSSSSLSSSSVTAMRTRTTQCEGAAAAGNRPNDVTNNEKNQTMAISYELIDRAVALDYGSRLRTCLLLQGKKVKNSTPY